MTASTGVLNVGIEDLEKANEDMREKVKLSQKNPFFLQAILDELERLKLSEERKPEESHYSSE